MRFKYREDGCTVGSGRVAAIIESLKNTVKQGVPVVDRPYFMPYGTNLALFRAVFYRSFHPALPKPSNILFLHNLHPRTFLQSGIRISDRI